MIEYYGRPKSDGMGGVIARRLPPPLAQPLCPNPSGAGNGSLADLSGSAFAIDPALYGTVARSFQNIDFVLSGPTYACYSYEVFGNLLAGSREERDAGFLLAGGWVGRAAKWSMPFRGRLRTAGRCWSGSRFGCLQN